MLKILVVDDDKDIRALLELALAIEYTVVTSATIAESKEILSRDKIDLVLVDIYLHNESGANLVYWMKANNLTAKIILVTGDSFFRDKHPGLRSLVDDVMMKPFDITDAIKVASKALEKKVETLDRKREA